MVSSPRALVSRGINCGAQGSRLLLMLMNARTKKRSEVATPPGHPKLKVIRADASTEPTSEVWVANTTEDVAVGAPKKDSRKLIEARWGSELTSVGWVALPTIILEKQKALGLDPLDLNIILQITKYWWEPGNLPHPSKKTIAEAIGIDPRTVQRRISALVELGFVTRVMRKGPKGNLSSSYDLRGLIDHATPYAKEASQQRAAARAAYEDRLRRMRPKVAPERADGGDAEKS